MNKEEFDSRWAVYSSTLLEVPSFHPQVSLDGKLYWWTSASIAISDVTGVLNYCTYEVGLKAKKKSEESGRLGSEEGNGYGKGEVEVEEEVGGRGKGGGYEFERIAEIGTLGHSLVDEESRNSVTRDLVSYLTSGVEGTYVFRDSLVCRGVYKGLGFCGRPDRLEINGEGNVERLVEYKFTKGGRWRDYFEIQCLLYSYFLYRGFGTLGFNYEVEVWDLEDVPRGEKYLQVEAMSSKALPIALKKKFKFTNRSIIVAEGYLNRAVEIYTGKRECLPFPSGGCFYCEFGNECKYSRP